MKLRRAPDGRRRPREITLRPNEIEPLQLDANTSVTLAEYIPDFFIRDNQVFKRSDDPVNPAFRLQVKNKATGEDAKLWMFPAYDETAQGEKTNYTFAYRDMQMGYFTGLEVSHEPGQWLVWAGVLLMGAGTGRGFLHGAHADLDCGRARCARPPGAVGRRPGQQEPRSL